MSTGRQLRRALLKISHCERGLREQVGGPDASRYRPGFNLFVKGCRSRDRVARMIVASIDDHSSPPRRELEQESARGDTYFEEARQDLEGALRANRDLPLIGRKSSRSRSERSLSRAASQLVWLSPTGLEVRCWSPEEWKFVEKEWAAYVARSDLLGFVQQASVYRTSIAAQPCAQLSALVYDHARPSSGRALLKMSLAVGVLAHESEHIRDSWPNEEVTECRAMQHIRQLARILGTSRSYADLLAETYWRDIYPLNTPEYRTPACHDRGPLDLNRGSSLWP